ncbi:Gfo/Idh/MocA family oxidoreductase [Paenibacillus doosanensis]|uniref:1,5-anhydro-D-fructose reductase n=1 Tax=Paenibacillus konkukensis TaxID=2020716 RepID=A0ABY4RHD3_9BACL|nr:MULTISPECIES: Gfo/Idh/MocA family oxidoreductase [Paenibacillus]MCS7459804.1 Gfo/Idh/MocA family oxidoreductase [Paenibacillus doosanensis]UQZ81777.1 1,5-anhydro-D-fructose reductase [Paenibacillus konkukensis]
MVMEPQRAGSLQVDYRPKLPIDRSRPIGIVGAGEIVAQAHLPAYRMAGFQVAGIYDMNQAKAEELANRYPGMKVFATLEAMLADPQIQIVDIAVPAKHQPDIALKAASYGKHLLCQKPLAETFGQARALVDACAAAGIKAAVNQQMRWSPGIQASRSIAARGWLGQLLQGTVQVNVHTPWENWPWLTQISTLEVMYHSIHYLDSIRYVLGLQPEYVYADGAKIPNQPYAGETRTMIHIKYPGDVRALVHDNHNNRMPQEDWYATFRFEGTEGVVKGTNGALYNYPEGREDTISLYSNLLEPGTLYAPKLEGRWFPHAFMGTMGELMRAIEEDREPENSIADNLITLRTVFAAYRSMSENRPVYVTEIE